MAKNEVAVIEENKNALPAYLQGKGKTASLGNIDQSDLIIPRVKLLQAISPEVTDFENAKAGQFWHSLAGEPLGEGLRFAPIMIRKSYTLWAPRGDNRGVLARANDGLNWDKKEVFTVRLKGMKKDVQWSTEEGTVVGSGLADFGSSNPEDDNSTPAATLTYQILAYFIDHPELSPAVMLLARSGVKRAKQLISKIEMRPVDHFAQVFRVTPVQEQGAEGPYYNYNFTGDGYVQDAALYDQLKDLDDRYNKAEWRASDEEDDSAATGAAPAGEVGGKKGKF